MFAVSRKGTGHFFGYVDKINYVVKYKGLYVPQISEKGADGISTPFGLFNIGNEEKIPGAEFVEWTEVDEKDIMMKTKQITENQTEYINTLQDLILDQDNYICTLEDALTEMDNQVNNE